MSTLKLSLLLTIVLLGIDASARLSAVGRAYVVDSETAAEQLATLAAQRSLAGQALDEFARKNKVSSSAFARSRNELLDRSDEFLVTLRVERKELRAGMLELELSAEYNPVALEKALSEFGVSSKKVTQRLERQAPAVMVLAYEEISGTQNSFPYVRQEIQQHLLEAGIRVVDHGAVERILKHDQAVQAVLNGNMANATNIALQFDAGVVLTAHALVQASALKSGPMQAYGATVTVQAHAADSGAVLTSVTSTGSYPHINAIQGAQSAIAAATAKAMQQVVATLQTPATQPGARMLMSIADVNFQQLALVKQVIERDFTQVQSMRNLGFTAGIARLELTLDGDPTQFAESLALKDYGAFRLEVLSQSPGKLDVALRL